MAGANLRICPVVGCVTDGPNATVIYPLADAHGDVVLNDVLDPAVEYNFLAMVVNVPGGTCPDYTDPQTGAFYWFPPAPSSDAPFEHGVTGTPSAMDNTTFYISDHC